MIIRCNEDISKLESKVKIAMGNNRRSFYETIFVEEESIVPIASYFIDRGYCVNYYRDGYGFRFEFEF